MYWGILALAYNLSDLCRRRRGSLKATLRSEDLSCAHKTVEHHKVEDKSMFSRFSLSKRLKGQGLVAAAIEQRTRCINKQVLITYLSLKQVDHLEPSPPPTSVAPPTEYCISSSLNVNSLIVSPFTCPTLRIHSHQDIFYSGPFYLLR